MSTSLKSPASRAAPDTGPDAPPYWALSALPHHPTEPWQRLTGGRINRVWRAGSVVLKVFDPARGTDFFPNDPHAEARALRHLAARGIAPRLVGMTEGEGIALALEAVRGGPPTSGEMAAVLRALHHLPPVSQTRLVHVEPAPIRAEVAALLAETGAFADLLPPEPPDPGAVRTQLALLHGDPVPANFVRDGSQCRLIDWGCAALGDPAFDIALALSPAMHHLYGTGDHTEHADSFVRAYGPCDTYARLAPWLHWRIAAYCLWKAAQGDSDYLPAARAEADLVRDLQS